jgi:hypothetical protein
LTIRKKIERFSFQQNNFNQSGTFAARFAIHKTLFPDCNKFQFTVSGKFNREFMKR